MPDGRETKGREHILVIANPVAGRGYRRRLTHFIERLKTVTRHVTLYETTAPGDAEHLTAGIDWSRFDAVTVAGGDGTINEVLNGLPASGPPLAVMPLGTANVLALEMGLPRSIDDLAVTVVTGRSRAVTLGEANGRRFAVMASVGLDAMVVEGVSLQLKRHVGKGAYAVEALRQFLRSSPAAYRLRVDGVERSAYGIIVANGRHYGGRFIAAPSADLETPSLQICQLTRSGRWAVPCYLASMLRGRLAERADYPIEEADHLEIIGPVGAPLQADGELLCRLPATIRILPAAVRLIFPKPTV